MILQGVKIQGITSLNNYFDFKAIYGLLKSDDSYIFYDFGKTNLKSYSEPLKIYLFGMPNQEEKGGAVAMIKNPEKCLEQEFACGYSRYKKIFEPAEDSSDNKNVCLSDVDFFADNMWRLFHGSYAIIHPELAKSDQIYNPEWGNLKKSVFNAVNIISENGKRIFSPEAATEVYLYFLLHALAAIPPDNVKSLEYIEDDLVRMCPVSEEAKKSCNRFNLIDEVIPLDYYDATECRNSPLSIVEFNNNSDNKLKITIKGTVISRTLYPDDVVYALRKGKCIVGFLPRFKVYDDAIRSIFDNSPVVSYDVDNCRLEETTISKPVIWARTSENGNIFIDQDGVLDKESAWQTSDNERLDEAENVVMADACALDYSLLLADGTTINRLVKINWKDLININIGLNSGIAINSMREPVLADGTVIRNIKAADARSYEEHYICMDKKGRILTDSKLDIMGKTVYAVAICAKGYVLAFENTLALYGFDNTLIKEWKSCYTTEIDAFENSIVYYDGNQDDVFSIDLN